VNTSGEDRSDSEDVISDNEVENPNRASVANRPTSVVRLTLPFNSSRVYVITPPIEMYSAMQSRRTTKIRLM
jgi:hypothetical protein